MPPKNLPYDSLNAIPGGSPKDRFLPQNYPKSGVSSGIACEEDLEPGVANSVRLNDVIETRCAREPIPAAELRFSTTPRVLHGPWLDGR